MADIEKMVAQFDDLVSAARGFLDEPGNIDGDDYHRTRAQIMYNRLESAIERFALPGSSHIVQLRRARAHEGALSWDLRELYAVAAGLCEDLKTGWATSVMELVHAGTHSDYLDMAEELLDKGYKDAAAVIAGSSLEVHARALCIKHNVDIELAPGKPKKADVLNADLKKAGVYGDLQQKQVTAWLGLRNKAAHGDYAAYDERYVRSLVQSVRDFMLRYPA